MTTLEVARVERAHGLRGDVVVALISDDRSRLAAGSELGSERGPLVVRHAHEHGRRWLVHFDGIDDRDAAEQLGGLVLRASPDPAAEGVWVHQVVGLEVVDTAGVGHGPVAAVQPNPAHDLLVLEDGTLVPAVFIVEIEDRIVVDVPEGLF